MKKCTLCIDRIYNENLEEEDRVPACVSTCPANARHFGDLGDPNSDVSRMVEDRGGYDLIPELQYQPVNKYLPPRPKSAGQNDGPRQLKPIEPNSNCEEAGGLFRWLDQVLTR
jgi:Fe-S-cluster-containing dehydrogenase component